MTKGEAIKQVEWLLSSGELAGLDEKSKEAIRRVLREAKASK